MWSDDEEGKFEKKMEKKKIKSDRKRKQTRRIRKKRIITMETNV